MTISENWLSTVNSPTYNFTLYLVKSEVANNPTVLSNDSSVLNTGRAYIIAKSGSETTYNIDNVVFTSTLVPGERSGNVQISNINFDITEVLGFDLLDRVLSVGSSFGFENITTAAFVLKLEFKGRNPVTGGVALYPGIFFYPIRLNAISATVGPDGARYNITAVMNPSIAITQARVETDISFTGVRTVSDYLNNLQTRLNQYESDIRKSDQNDITEPGRRHSIRMGSRFASSLANAEFAGLASSSDGTATALEQTETLSFSVNVNSSIPTVISDTLTKEIPAYQELYRIGRASLASRAPQVDGVPYIVVNMDIEYGTVPDPQTLQRIDTIVYTVELFYSMTRPDAEEPAVEVADRTNSNRQYLLFEQMRKFMAKSYSYLFSGDNTEILNLDLNYDMLYFSAKAPSGGLNYTDPAQDFQPQVAEPVNRPIGGFLSGRTVVPRIRGLITPVYDYTNASAYRQRVSETTGSVDPIVTTEAKEYFGQFNKVINLQITIKGDPFWMGLPGTDTSGGALTNAQNVLKNDSLIGLVNFLPHESVTYTTNRHRGRLDPFTTGVYRVTQISSRFQMGKFTQTLSTTKHTELTTALVENAFMGLL
jgi:hypothetical protein